MLDNLVKLSFGYPVPEKDNASREVFVLAPAPKCIDSIFHHILQRLDYLKSGMLQLGECRILGGILVIGPHKTGNRRLLDARSRMSNVCAFMVGD